ncbi:hypothetical protein HNV10_09630 [Winogradskyella litoriviva]|uniref:Uncharacterized protein n=1 Tax=Winogradskyella litoriviva TaxID=1220182 RepID=A0ABX2E5C6_9FLAO|nr:hypothetical protein [Winogradskyella litoriviva]NRD23499.1 hypothetical protein [Winogradskyella litoriviva]
MRTDNRNIKNKIISIYFILVVCAILFATVFKSLNLFQINTLYIIIGLFLAVLFVHFIARFFEYDSDGTNLIIKNKGLILADFVNYREHKIEIPKYKIEGFHICNYLVFKSLVLVVKYSDGSIVKERFNITLLKKKKIKYVRQSLKKIIKQNKKVKQG